MANGNGKVTPTQQRILDLLSDGMRHSREEVFTCLNDELQKLENIQVHLCHLRKVLRPKGQDIVCELFQRRLYYRHIILLSDD